MFKKILLWWNNLSFCQKKKQQWLEQHTKQLSDENMLYTIKWPETVFHTSKNDFTESDWVYQKGDRCERYIAWFFKWITERCTVEERQLYWIPMDCPTGIGGAHPAGYVTTYKVKDDDGDVHNNVYQNDLSF